MGFIRRTPVFRRSGFNSCISRQYRLPSAISARLCEKMMGMIRPQVVTRFSALKFSVMKTQADHTRTDGGPERRAFPPRLTITRLAARKDGRLWERRDWSADCRFFAVFSPTIRPVRGRAFPALRGKRRTERGSNPDALPGLTPGLPDRLTIRDARARARTSSSALPGSIPGLPDLRKENYHENLETRQHRGRR